jgi:peptide/nickel transport system substrate-binding protein
MRSVRTNIVGLVTAALIASACGTTTTTSPVASDGQASSPSVGQPSGGASAPTGKIVTIANDLAGAGIDLTRAPSGGTHQKPWWDEVFDYPIEQDLAGKLIPGLATSWEASPDGLTWKFVIRDGVRFHNGDILTAEDAAWSWSRIIEDPESVHSLIGYAEIIESIEPVDDTVVIKTTEPLATLPLSLSKLEGNLGGTVQSKKYFESAGLEKFAREPIGTGPYRLVRMDGEQSADLTAFEDSERNDWQKSRTPQIKDITVRAVPDPSTRLALLRTGEADLAPLPISSLGELQAAGLQVISSASTNFSGMLCLGFTLVPTSACNDKRVREALSIAIDRQAIAEAVYGGEAIPSGGFYVGPGSFAYPADLEAPPFDADRAKQLLGEAGFGDGTPLSVEIILFDNEDDFPDQPTLAEAIAGYYQKIGVNAEISVMDERALKDTLYEGKFRGQVNSTEVSPVVLYLRGIDNRYYLTAEHIAGYEGDGRVAVATWNNVNLPEQQTRLDAVKNEFDVEAQGELFADYLRWMRENFINIPLLASNAVFGATTKIGKWTPITGKPFVHNQWTITPGAGA